MPLENWERIMPIIQTETFQEITSAISTNVTEIFQEDILKTLRFIYRDGGVIEETAEEVAHNVRQLHTYKETEVKLKKSLENQFTLLSKRLMEWCEVNSANLFTACWVPIKSEVYFFAVQNSNAYSEEFSRNLTRLEIEVEDSEQFFLITMKVLELPKMDEKSVHEFVSNYTSGI
jgi:hypothetical protein